MISRDGFTVSLAYFRAGYIPLHYTSDIEWDGLLITERANAVKCPSIGLFLAGSKKIQQRLAEKGVLESFLDPNHADLLRTTFSMFWVVGALSTSISAATTPTY